MNLKSHREAVHEVSMKKHNMKKQELHDTLSAGNETSAVQLQIGKRKYIYIFKIPLDILLIL